MKLRGGGLERGARASKAVRRPRSYPNLLHANSCINTEGENDMTCLHKVEQRLSLKGHDSESHCCIDCGYNTNPGAPPRELAEFLINRDGEFPVSYTEDSEVYFVRSKIWKAAGMGPWGGCLCIGCLERRIGRKLKPRDFDPSHPFNWPNIPRTDRLRDRLGY